MIRLLIAVYLIFAALTMAGTVHAQDSPPQVRFSTATSAFERGDFPTALRLFRALADQGDAVAQRYLALMYDQGLGS